MIRLAKALLCVLPMSCLLCAQTTPTPQTPASSASEDKSSAYYNFAMGRLYAVMAENEGNKNDYVSKAIQYYQAALKADPSASMIFEELTDLYIATNRLSDAITQAQDMLKKDPENLTARRMLGRIYLRALSNSAPGRGNASANEENLKKALEEYKTITEKDPKDAESWVMLGNLYRASSNSPEAEKAYNNALKADPDNEDAMTRLAVMYSELGDIKSAIEKLKTVTNKSPNPRTLASLAELYEQQQDFKSAAEVLKKALEVSPDDGRLARGLAQDLLYSDQLDEALKLFEKLSAEEPRDPQLPLNIAEIYRAKHDLAKAREYLNKAKTLDGQNREVRYEEVKLLEAEGNNEQAMASLKTLLADTTKRTYNEGEARARALLLREYGRLLRNAEKYSEAIEAYRQLGSLPGVSGPEATLQVIDTYRQSKDYTSALKELDAAAKKFPNDRMVTMEHATVIAEQGKVDQGATELRTLLKGDDDREIHVTLAQIYEKAKRYNEEAKALDDAEKASKTDEEKEGIYFMRGAMYERMKKLDASEAEFRKVLALSPDHAGALNYLGYMLADRGVRLDEAYTMIKKALDADPDNGAYLDSMGWVLYRQGKLAEAEGMLQRALAHIGAEDPTVHDHLGDIYAKLGKTREAIAQWQASLKAFQSASGAESDPEEVAKVTKKLDDARVRLAQEMKKK